MMKRIIPSQTIDEIRRELAGDIEECRKWCVMPDLTWAPGVLALMERLSLLASASNLDADEIKRWIQEARARILSEKLKGLDALVWAGEDLLWYATHPILAK